MRFSGSRVKISFKISLSSSESGRIVFKKSRSRKNTEKVSSRRQACFQGLRPQVRLIRITPKDHTSLEAVAYPRTLLFSPP